ncbi:acyl-CoA carboxylase subunit epsilon [Schumannella luteola]
MTEQTPPEIRVVSKGATAFEIAAVTAVVSATLEELADAQSADGEVESAWMRGRRSLRQPLHPGPGAWRAF